MSDLKRHLWFLSKTPALAALPPAARTQIASATDLRERPRKTCLYRAGEVADHVYCLHGGRVTALRAAEGSRAVTLGIYGPGDVFGESCLWNPSPREHDAVASTSVLYAAIPRALLRLLLDEHPAAALLLAEQAITRRELVIRRLSVAMSTSVRARLADQLLALAEFGSDLPEGRALALSLTHHDRHHPRDRLSRASTAPPRGPRPHTTPPDRPARPPPAARAGPRLQHARSAANTRPRPRACARLAGLEGPPRTLT